MYKELSKLKNKETIHFIMNIYKTFIEIFTAKFPSKNTVPIYTSFTSICSIKYKILYS